MWMKSRSGNAGAPHERTHSSYSVHIGRWVRSYSARNSSQPVRSATGYPEKTGGTSRPRTSSGLHDIMRTNGLPAVSSAGKQLTLSSINTSGRWRSMISCSCGWQYLAPSINACHVGCTNVDSCSMVGLRNSGEVSRMKSIQNCPASSAEAAAASGGGARSTRSSSKPSACSLPAHDASAANTTR